MRQIAFALGLFACILTGCAHPSTVFRLANGPQSKQILIPPGVKDATVAQATIPIRGLPGKRVCAPSPSGLRVERKVVLVSRDALEHATADEIKRWSASMEKTGCIPPGDAYQIAASLVDALPLELSKRTALHGESLTISGQLDISAVNSFRVVSPVFRPGTAPETSALAAEPAKVTASGNGLNVELRSNPALTGYEIAWYDVRLREDGHGFRVAPRSAEIHIADRVEPESSPQVNRFDFEPDARWFRYFLLTRSSTDRNDYDMVLLSARTASDLEARTAAFRKDSAAYLRAADGKSYAAMTSQFGVNPYMLVKVNGVMTDVPPGATLRQTIETSAGRGSASGIMTRLSVLKPHKSKLARVEWDHGSQEILNLTLEGGEEISW